MNGRWAYYRYARRPLGPFHPTGKNALVCVTRAGNVRFIYQTPDSKWAEVAAELRSAGSSSGVLTHAAMIPVEGIYPFPIKPTRHLRSR
jgi:mediator of RNA polymerase II transcription subunit 16